MRVKVVSDSWIAPATPPSALLTAEESSPIEVEALAALLFVGIWTRPPVTYGFSLSDCWAWLRYFPAVATTPDLRLRDEWTTLDAHHKTVLSDDFGVGFTTWFLFQTLGFQRYADTFWVVNSLLPNTFRLAPSAKRGPTKSPDYIVEDLSGEFSVLECKGGQSTCASLRAAMNRGAAQKSNLQVIGTTPLRHSLVAGLFIPQFESWESAVLIVADPEWDEIRKLLSPFSKAELARSVVGVSYAKELAMLDLPNVANALVRADGGDGSMANALERDRVWRQRQARALADETHRVERDYRWSSPVKLAEDRVAVGIRFTGSLPISALEELVRLSSPIAIAEAKQDHSRAHAWQAEGDDLTVTLRSPLGSTFGLSVLDS
jgi:hypothetical protein